MISSEQRALRRHCGTGTRVLLYSYELLTLGYLVLSAVVVLVRHAAIQSWAEIISLHLAFAGGILLVASMRRFSARLRAVCQPIRGWYLLALYPFLFKELTDLAPALFPFYLEPFLLQSERFFLQHLPVLFGTAGSPPILTEVMAFAYWSYYAIIFAVGVYLYKAWGDEAFDRYMFRICATFLICYLLFILMPARGPHHAMRGVDPWALHGGVFYTLISFMQSKGSTVGAAFPSSHVAVAWIAAFSLRAVHRFAYYLMLPLLILLSLSVFFLRYHYFLDAIFGIILAICLERCYIFMVERKMQCRFTFPLLQQASTQPEKAERWG